jgi:hypothetical protein
MKKILALLSCAALAGSFYAQSQLPEGAVNGRLLDAAQQALSYANVLVYQAADSMLYKGGISDEQGAYAIEGLKPGAYYITASYVGLETATSPPFEINAVQPFASLAPLVLSPSGQTLESVTVVAQKPFIERHLDKLVVNVENSIVSAGNSAMEVLERSPGVLVDQNGNISLRGKSGVIVMIDGKPSQLGGAGLANLLRGMPAAGIEKIEIITNPSARYDAAGNAGIIDIKTKKDQNQGLNGSLSAGAGHGRYPKAETGVNLNYRKGKWNVFGNYNFSYRKAFNNLILYRNFSENGQVVSAFDQNNLLVFPFRFNTARAGIDWSAGKRTTLGISLSGIDNRFDPAGDNFTYVRDGNRQVISEFATTNRSKDVWQNYAANFNFRHAFNDAGRELAFDLDYARYGNKTFQLFNTDYRTALGELMHTDVLKGDIEGFLDIQSVKADYIHPLGKETKAEAGVKSSLVTTDNDLQYFNIINDVEVFDSTQSNRFIYTERIHAAYVNFSHGFRGIQLQAGLRAEQTVADGLQVTTDSSFQRNYWQLFPSVFITHPVGSNDKHELSYSYSRRIDRPSYRQLNPFRAFVDPTTYQEGNPFLKPQLSHNFELSYTYDKRFTATLAFSRTDDNITSVLLQNDAERVTIQTEINFESFHYYGFSLSAPVQITPKWNSNNSFNLYYGNYSGFVGNGLLDQGSVNFNINSINSISLPKNWAMEVNLFARSREVYGVSTIKAMGQFTVGVQKSFLDRRATFRLNVSDIFYTGVVRGSTLYQNVDEIFESKRESRVASVNFTYRFGKNTISPARRRAGGAEEEKRRASSGTG